MGCCSSIKKVDPDRIHSPIVLHTNGECCRYHGTTERGRLQKLGNAQLILSEDGIYSQVLGTVCCLDRGYLYIPLLAITDIREQAWFNGLYRLDHPHLVINYRVAGKDEYQAGWQMNQTTYEQWKTAIERLLEETYMTELN